MAASIVHGGMKPFIVQGKPMIRLSLLEDLPNCPQRGNKLGLDLDSLHAPALVRGFWAIVPC